MSLDGVYAKVNRAEDDFHHLQAAMFPSPSNDSYRAFIYEDLPGGNFRADIRIPVDGLTRWAVETGGIARDLQSALDLLYCELVRKRDPRSKCAGTYFPICLRAEYVKNQQALVLRQVGQGVEAILDRMQVPDASDARRENPLWQLKRLATRDDHRTEPTIEILFGHYVASPKPHLALFDPVLIDEKVFAADNTKLLTIEPPPQMKVQGPPSIEIALTKPLPGREPLVPLLNKVFYSVESVIDVLAPLAR